ncbi:MAG: hypothetical protein D6812_10775 [Deltaproteobacteria bacterium]|nr:MAG: hypothetical protein D6812_10775 [Deltaproteobacteria bacterium]
MSRSDLLLLRLLFLLLLLLPAGAAAQPRVSVSLEESRIRAGETVRLHIVVSWSAGEKAYQISPPDLELPEQIRRIGMSSSTQGVGDLRSVHFVFTLRPEEKGTWTIPAIDIPYHVSGDTEAYHLRGEPVTLEVTGWFTRRLAAGIGGALLLVAATIAWLLYRQRRGGAAPAPTTAGSPTRSDLEARLAELNRHRLAGEAGRFYETMRDLVAALPERAQRDFADLDFDPLIEGIKYGGRPRSSREIEEDYRRMERTLKRLREGEDPGIG